MFRTYIPPAEFNVEAAQFRPNPRRGAPEAPPPQFGVRLLQKRPLEGDAPTRVAVPIEMPAPKVRKTNNWERPEYFRGAHSSGKKFNAQINNLTIYQRQYMDNKNKDKWSIKILDAAIKYAQKADRPVDAMTNKLFRNRALETNFSFDYVSNFSRLENLSKTKKGVTVIGSDTSGLPNGTLDMMLQFSEKESAALNVFVLITTMQKLENAKTVLAQGSSDKGSTTQALGSTTTTLGTNLPPTAKETGKLNPNNPDGATGDGDAALPLDGSDSGVKEELVYYDAEPEYHPDRSKDAEDAYLRLLDARESVNNVRRLRDQALDDAGTFGADIQRFEYGSEQERDETLRAFRDAESRFQAYNIQLVEAKAALNQVTRELMALDGVEPPPSAPVAKQPPHDGEKPLKDPKQEKLRQWFNKFVPDATEVSFQNLVSLKVKKVKEAKRVLAEAKAEKERLNAIKIQTRVRAALARNNVAAKLSARRKKKAQEEADEAAKLDAAAQEEAAVAEQAVKDAEAAVENAQEELKAADPNNAADGDAAAIIPEVRPPSIVPRGGPSEFPEDGDGGESDVPLDETLKYDDGVDDPRGTPSISARATTSAEKRQRVADLQLSRTAVPMASFGEDDAPVLTRRSNSDQPLSRRGATRGTANPELALENLQTAVKEQLGLTMPSFTDKNMLQAFVIDLVDKASLIKGKGVKAKRNLAKSTLRAMISAGLIDDIMISDGTKSTLSYINELNDDTVDTQKMDVLKGVLLRRLKPQPAGQGFAENMDSIVSASLIAEDPPNQQYLYVVQVR